MRALRALGQVDAAVLDQGKWGVGPGAACYIDRVCPTGQIWKACFRGRSAFSGEWHDAIARAQRVAPHLEPAWERERAARDSRSRPVSLSIGRCAPDQVRHMAAGRTSGELPGQVTDQLAAGLWGPQMAPDQPPASAKLCR
jgi:hypothetical protein